MTTVTYGRGGFLSGGDGNITESDDTIPDSTGYLNDLLRSDEAVLPGGVFRITEPLAMRDGTSLDGAGTTANLVQQAPTVIVKDGDFDALRLGAACKVANLQIDGANGNGGDGIVVDDVRCVLESVAITRQGQDGLRIGGKITGRNANLARLADVRCLNNTRHGIYVDDVDTTAKTGKNANSMMVQGLDVRDNGGDGIHIARSIDGQWFGLFVATNGGIGLRLAAGANGHGFFMPYLEANTGGDLQIDAGAADNLVWGKRQGTPDTWVDNGTGNLLMGRAANTDRFTVFPRLDFETLRINDRDISGTWELAQDPANRALRIILKDTGNSPVAVVMAHDDPAKQVAVQVTGTLTTSGTHTPTGGINLPNGANISAAQSTGSQIGTASTQKLGFYGATPTTRPAGVAVTAEAIHAALVSLGLITR